ncbi:hypothetical protein MVES1_000606 [Malassezia vespertilionis]|uniref:uncharacterized protein n=1 Tax=Malassezia vespertilionis TaxID=2020962 RepID=UPI0024B0944C|nr:uncharacterized protein MVES1_000606 [Malassezia vespertilionis]WFD05277.1 hypothetical protein MVES1_000606 [Malassezia vespertilionis]
MSMLGMENTTGEINKKYASCATLLSTPGPTPLEGTPKEYLQAESNATKEKRRDLESILLLVRKLREGLVSSARFDAFTLDVYELSIVLSILCGNMAQLSLALARMFEDVYPITTESDANTEHPVAVDVAVLFHHDPNPSSLWQSSLMRGRRAMFECLWLLEAVIAARPGHMHEFLARRCLLQARQGRSDARIDFFMQFANTAYTALQRADSETLLRLFSNDSSCTTAESLKKCSFSALFWPKALALNLIVKVRTCAEHVVRRAYLQIPARQEFVTIVKGLECSTLDVKNELTSNLESIRWLETRLLLDLNTQEALFGKKEHGTNDTNLTRSLDLLYGIARQLGEHRWNTAIAQLRNRVSSTPSSHTLKLKP